MIEVAQEIITEYMTDSTNKEVVIDGSRTGGQTLDEVNYYTGSTIDWTATNSHSSATFNYIPIYHSAGDSDWSDCVEWSYASDYEYITIAFDFWCVMSNPFYAPGYWRIIYTNSAGVSKILNISGDYLDSYINQINRVMLTLGLPSDGLQNVTRVDFVFNETTPSTDVTFWIRKIQVNFLNNQYIPKYYNPTDFTSFDADDYTAYQLDNDDLIYEDFALTESLCSKDNIKFGLCEAAHCEFSAVNSDMSIGDTIYPKSALLSNAELTDDELFGINWASKDTSTPIELTTSGDSTRYFYIIGAPYGAYWGKYTDDLDLASKYVKTTWKLKIEIVSATTTPEYFRIRYFAVMNGGNYYFTGTNVRKVSDYSDYNEEPIVDPITRNNGIMQGISHILIMFCDADGNAYSNNDIVANIYAKDFQVRITSDYNNTMPDYSIDDLYVANNTIDEYLEKSRERIPYGKFTISNIANQYAHNLIKRKVTAYDNLLPLENNAADWYTSYMFGVDTDGYASNGFEYARQIFSTYWSYISEIGLDSVNNYTLTTIGAYDDSDFIANQNSNYKYIMWQQDNVTYYLCYAMKEVQISDPSLLYRVTWDNYLGETDEDHKAWFSYYGTYVDSLFRGATHNGGVLIEEYKSGEATPYNCFCVNSGDFFMLSDETAFIRFLLPSGNKTTGFSLCVNVTLESAEPRETLINGNLRLCYYNYSTKDIFACDSSITGRDVVRSLLEVCGCFFRMSRYGLPEFVYPTKGGLYPSNTLYPEDDLYPRAGTDLISSMGKYMSVIAEDYEVTDYGRIQILKNVKSSNTESVCEWQYEGDADKKNTYIIDDNIFYCADDMLYDYGGMPEVADMLEGMWNVISNLGYVPNVTQALGAPWIECGDRIGLLTYDGGFETFVFRRTLKGIQNLRDTYESAGDEYNEAINNFGY